MHNSGAAAIHVTEGHLYLGFGVISLRSAKMQIIFEFDGCLEYP
jgi:hypothetical protein